MQPQNKSSPSEPGDTGPTAEQTLDSQTLQTWLEWAGVRLIAMPGPKVRPSDPKVIWPEYSQDNFEILTFRRALPVRVGAPTPKEIPIVDEILQFPNACERAVVRRILHVRSLMHPVRGTYLYKWSRIAELLDVKVYTVKRLHVEGLKEASEKADPKRVCRITAFFSETAL